MLFMHDVSGAVIGTGVHTGTTASYWNNGEPARNRSRSRESGDTGSGGGGGTAPHLNADVDAAKIKERIAAGKNPLGSEGCVWDCKMGLGAVLTARGNSMRGAALQEQVLAFRRRVLPPDHPDIATARYFLGRALSVGPCRMIFTS